MDPLEGHDLPECAHTTRLARFPIGTEFTDFPASVFRYAALLPGYRKTGPSSETLAALSRISSGSG